jgi:hypothetical protein
MKKLLTALFHRHEWENRGNSLVVCSVCQGKVNSFDLHMWLIGQSPRLPVQK